MLYALCSNPVYVTRKLTLTKELLIRSGKDPWMPVSPEASAAFENVGVFGKNVGNVLYTNAVHRSLMTEHVDVVSNSYLTERTRITAEYIDHINERFDAFIVPLANAFRPDFLRPLRRLTKVISKLKIPVVVVGVGTQLPIGESEIQPEVAEATREFVKAVLERSASIGVRGEITQTMLTDLGFSANDIDVIGCPSMFWHGDQMRIRHTAALDSTSRLSMNITEEVGALIPIIDEHAERFPDLTVIGQEIDFLTLLLWGQDPQYSKERPVRIDSEHRLYTEDKLRFFVDGPTWINYLSTRDFVFGTRLHGNVAALLGGTPAMLLAHDSRTLELADYHRLPYRLMSQLHSNVRAEALHAEADFTALEQAQSDRFGRYLAFLERNELEHIWQPGNETEKFDARVAAADFPGAVHTLMQEGEERHRAIIDRLSWLRQGQRDDKARTTLGYQPPVPRLGVKDVNVRKLEKRVTQLEKQLERTSSELREQYAQIRAHLDRPALPVRLYRAARWRFLRLLRVLKLRRR